MATVSESTEAQGLLAAQPEPDDEEPRRCGSHIDKLCLFPFILVLVALGFYGSKGWKDVDLFLAGNAQAQEACAPLADLDQQCTGKLVVNAELAAGAVDDARGAVRHAWRNATTLVVDPVEEACGSVASGAEECSEEVSKVLGAFDAMLVAPPQMPVRHADGDNLEEASKDMLQNVTSYISKVDAVCAKVLGTAADLCKRVDRVSRAEVQKMSRAVDALTGDALDMLEVTVLSVLNHSSNEVCPHLETIPSGCRDIRHSLRDAFANAAEAALALLPAGVPGDALQAALDSISGQALGVVDERCKSMLSIADDCATEIFGEDTWHPILQGVMSPLEEVRLKLQDVIADVNESGSVVCTRLSDTIAGACSKWRNASTAAIGKMKEGIHSSNLTASEREAVLNDAKNAISGSYDSFRSGLATANESLHKVAGAVAGAAATVRAPCGTLRNSTAAVESQLSLLTRSLEPVGSITGQLEDGCSQLLSVHDGCVAAANPMAVFAEGSTGLWKRKSFEIMKLEACMIGVGSLFVLMLMVMIKCAVMTLIRLSVAMNLASVFSMIIFNMAIWDTIMALFFTGLFVFKCVWFRCLWSRMEYAGALIQCGVDAIERKLGFLVWLLGIFVLFLQAGVLAASFLTLYHFTGPNPPEMELELPPYVIPALIVFAMTWAVEAFADALHVTICCLLGSVCGVKTPASSCPMATLFAFTVALGSVVAGAFWVAVLKALEYVYEQITKSKNAVVQVIGRCVCMAFQWAIQMFNSYAFVYVGMKGISYCDAAKRTSFEMGKNGMAAVATNQALHSVVKVARMVVTYVSCLCSLFVGYHFSIITGAGSWQEVVAAPFLCLALAMLTSYGLSLTLGRLLEAATCTLFIVFDSGAYKEAMREALPRVYAHLEAHVPKDDDDDCC